MRNQPDWGTSGSTGITTYIISKRKESRGREVNPAGLWDLSLASTPRLSPQQHIHQVLILFRLVLITILANIA